MSITYDQTKSYAEFGNAFFRGQLKGATGEARFKLTADAVNAVNTVNIAGNQLTYNFGFRYADRQVANGQSLISAVIDVIDTEVYIEFMAYGRNAKGILIDGSSRPVRGVNRFTSRMMPYGEIMYMAPGQHTVSLIGNGGYSAEGWIFCRYIRRTGSENV